MFSSFHQMGNTDFSRIYRERKRWAAKEIEQLLSWKRGSTSFGNTLHIPIGTISSSNSNNSEILYYGCQWVFGQTRNYKNPTSKQLPITLSHEKQLKLVRSTRYRFMRHMFTLERSVRLLLRESQSAAR